MGYLEEQVQDFLREYNINGEWFDLSFKKEELIIDIIDNVIEAFLKKEDIENIKKEIDTYSQYRKRSIEKKAENIYVLHKFIKEKFKEAGLLDRWNKPLFNIYYNECLSIEERKEIPYIKRITESCYEIWKKMIEIIRV